nr:hypothetical protein K-LCC10_0417 [Kaumoebavirus]
MFLDNISTRTLILTKPGPIDVWEIYYSFMRRYETDAVIPVEMGAEAYTAFVKRGNLKIIRTDHNPDDEPLKKILLQLEKTNPELITYFNILKSAVSYSK